MICKIAIIFFLIFSVNSHSFADDCNMYNAFSKKIMSSPVSDEIKLKKINEFTSDNIIQCEKSRYDIDLLNRKIFSYVQNSISITPLFISSCSTIINDDTCNSEQSDWSRGFGFRYNNHFAKKIIDTDAEIPFIVNEYKLHSIYYHWVEKNGDPQKVKLSTEKHKGGVNLAKDSLDKIITLRETLPQDKHYSQMWLSMIYKKNDSDFVKVVWYY